MSVCNNPLDGEVMLLLNTHVILTACDVKCDGLVSLDSPSCGVPCFGPAFGGLSAHYPTGQRIIPFEARRSPLKWTRVLEPV
jgi:hypothetical protein